MSNRVADGIARSGLAFVLLMAAVLVPGSGQVLAATDTLKLAPVADAWVNSTAPTTNYGAATTQKARVTKAETFLRFNLAAWQGLRIAALGLNLHGVTGDATPLRLATTGATWSETDLKWNNRPAASPDLPVPAVVNGTTARFEVKSLFPNGVIDKVTLSLRVATPSDLLVTFGSRETSTIKPMLTLDVASRTDTVDLPATADTWANSSLVDTNYGSGTGLKAAAGVKKEAFLKFDLSAWQGRAYDSLKLRFAVTAATAPSISVYRIGTTWKETTLTWANRPTGGSLLATVDTSLDVGTRTIDVSTAFASRTVEDGVLSLLVIGTGTAAMTFSSREGTTAPVVRLFPATTVSPPPTPSPTPTAPPTASPSPTPTPTAAPTATPTATPAPTSSAPPTATPTPMFYFTGHGTDHGVGMPQTGAKARANAGQIYDTILNTYYTGVTLGPLPPEKLTIRVLLSSAFVPTPTEPARVIARGGAWQSTAFPDQVFPADSYLDMDVAPNGTWTANVHDPLTGDVLASLDTTDLTMTPAEPATLFYMKFRDSLRKYDLYRGSMRLRVNGSGIQSVNIVGMDDYVQGVVPAEMIATWPIEALKVQAVAARSYGAGKLKTTGYYDVVPTSTNQVYGGVNIETTKTNNATQATAGIVVWYLDKIATTYFFDTAGGATENSEYAWPSTTGVPGTAIPYLRGIADVDANGVPYDINMVSYAWSSAQFTMAQLSSIFSKDSRTNVGTITSLTYYRGVSGRLYKVVMVGKSATKTVSGAIFKNAYNNNLLSGSSLKSTMLYLTPVTP